jgi:phage protein D/phage baseplate assembly protein gpV
MNSVLALPDLRIELAGTVLAASDAAALARIRVRQRLSLPSQCELVFNEPGTLDDPSSLLRPGASLRLQIPGSDPALFDGEVTAVEYVYEPSGGRSVRVRAYDLLHRLRKRQPVRLHVQMTAADLARELVADLGVSVQAEESGPLQERIFQVGRSDLDLLDRTARRAGLYFTLQDGAFRLFPLSGTDEVRTLKRGDTLLEARLEVNGDPACRSVATQGWDPARAESRRGKATGPRTGRSVSTEVAPSDVGGSGDRTRLNVAVGDDRLADALAQAELDLAVAREVTFWGVAEGDPGLRPGCRIELQGVAPLFQGTYVLSSVEHRIDPEHGFVSEVATLPPPPREESTATVAALGQVTQVDDPEKLGRIRASLPAHGELETGWIEVLVPGAGKAKGLVALPGIGDRVLLLFPEGDPAQAVVAGSLYGSDGPPDSGVEGGAIRRYTFSTPGGQKVQLDDAGKKVRLEDQSGNYLELSPDRAILHAAVDLTLEAPGRAVVIRGRSVDFDQA